MPRKSNKKAKSPSPDPPTPTLSSSSEDSHTAGTRRLEELIAGLDEALLNAFESMEEASASEGEAATKGERAEASGSGSGVGSRKGQAQADEPDGNESSARRESQKEARKRSVASDESSLEEDEEEPDTSGDEGEDAPTIEDFERLSAAARQAIEALFNHPPEQQYTPEELARMAKQKQEMLDYLNDPKNFETCFERKGEFEEMVMGIAGDKAFPCEELREAMRHRTRLVFRQTPAKTFSILLFIVKLILAAKKGFFLLTSAAGRQVSFWTAFFPLIAPFFRNGGKAIITVPAGEASEDVVEEMRGWMQTFEEEVGEMGGSLKFTLVTDFDDAQSWHIKEFLLVAEGGDAVDGQMSCNMNSRGVGAEAAYAKDKAGRKAARSSSERLTVYQLHLHEAEGREFLHDLGEFWEEQAEEGNLFYDAGSALTDLLGAFELPLLFSLPYGDSAVQPLSPTSVASDISSCDNRVSVADSVDFPFLTEARHTLNLELVRIRKKQRRVNQGFDKLANKLDSAVARAMQIAMANASAPRAPRNPTDEVDGSGEELEDDPTLDVQIDKAEAKRLLDIEKKYVGDIHERTRPELSKAEKMQMAEMNDEMASEVEAGLPELKGWVPRPARRSAHAPGSTKCRVEDCHTIRDHLDLVKKKSLRELKADSRWSKWADTIFGLQQFILCPVEECEKQYKEITRVCRHVAVSHPKDIPDDPSSVPAWQRLGDSLAKAIANSGVCAICDLHTPGKLELAKHALSVHADEIPDGPSTDDRWADYTDAINKTRKNMHRQEIPADYKTLDEWKPYADLVTNKLKTRPAPLRRAKKSGEQAGRRAGQGRKG
ncbi:hypothetical protein JCM11641_004982 [Rhodosporidiobolus odoratus]